MHQERRTRRRELEDLRLFSPPPSTVCPPPLACPIRLWTGVGRDPIAALGLPHRRMTRERSVVCDHEIDTSTGDCAPSCEVDREVGVTVVGRPRIAAENAEAVPVWYVAGEGDEACELTHPRGMRAPHLLAHAATEGVKRRARILRRMGVELRTPHGSRGLASRTTDQVLVAVS